MPTKNVYHDAVVAALIADGWTITDDALAVTIGKRDLHIDLGAERPVIGAERGDEKIAVEVQSFLNLSDVRSLQEALSTRFGSRAARTKALPGSADSGVSWDSVGTAGSDDPGRTSIAGAGLRPTMQVVQWIS